MSSKTAGFFTFLFFIVGFTGVYFHELWRDEIMPWSIAKASHSFSDLLYNSRYDALPILWYGFLFILSKFTHELMLMQLSHLLIACTSVFVFFRYSPFSFLEKLLIVSGYFFIYEYAVISRVYSSGVLFIFLFCSFYHRENRNFLLLSIFLFFACLTNVYACIVSIALLIFACYDFFSQQNYYQVFADKRNSILLSIIISVSGVISYIMIAMVPPDSSFIDEWFRFYSWDRVMTSISTVWNSFVPIPSFSNYQFWNSNILTSLSLTTAFSIIFIFIFSFSFFQSRQVLLFFLTGIFGLILFFQVKYIGYLRHHGHLYLLLIIALWLDKVRQPVLLPWHFLNKTVIFFKGIRNILFRSILIIHLLVGIYAYYSEIKYPFSSSKAAGAFILKNNLQNNLIIGNPDYTSYSVAGWMQKPVYYIASDTRNTFIFFDNKRKIFEGEDEINKSVAVMKENNLKEAVWLFNHPVMGKTPMNLNIVLLNKFETSIVADEVYYIYKVTEK